MGHRALSVAAAVVVLLLAEALSLAAPNAAQSAPAFDSLSETQQRLLAGLVTPPPGTNRSSDDRALFDGAEPSFRHAFATITAALAAVSLSDHENGEILGVALDLIDGIEPLPRQPAAGGATGRARLAVTLAPGARDRLRRSSEFTLDSDSATTAHPAGYRQKHSPWLELALDAGGTRAIVSLPR